MYFAVAIHQEHDYTMGESTEPISSSQGKHEMRESIEPALTSIQWEHDYEMGESIEPVHSPQGEVQEFIEPTSPASQRRSEHVTQDFIEPMPSTSGLQRRSEQETRDFTEPMPSTSGLHVKKGEKLATTSTARRRSSAKRKLFDYTPVTPVKPQKRKCLCL